MKKIYTILLSFLSFAAIAQDGTLVDPTNSQTRQASAALEVYSTNQGFLPPRVALTSTSDATTVTGTEPNGLMVYNTATAGDVTPGYYYWTGSAWSRMLNGATNLSGSGTTNYLARWTPNGNTLGIGATYDNGTNVGISSTSPGAKLDVNGGNVRTTTSGDAKFEFFGSSADRGFVGWQASAPVGVHLLNKDNTPIYFGTTNAERMRIDAVGNVGIGNTNPSGKLHVTGEVIRTNTRVNSNQRYPMAHNGGEDLLGIDPTWSNAELQAYFNSSNVQWSNDATAPSGYAIQITGPVNVGGDYGSGFPYIPIENGASYYMECWIRSSAANVGHYMGSIEYNENMTGGSGNPGSYGYWVMSNSMPGTSWVKVTGTISGFGTAVGQFQTGKKYWTPQALFNYTNGGGATTFISGWKVVKIPSGMTTPSLATNYIQNQTSGDQTAGFRITGNGLFNGGNVGIGTTSPSEKLHIIGNIRGNIAGAIRINTGNGYVDVGPQNTGWSHFQTDRPRFYFNVGGTFDTGQIGSYDEDLSLQTSGTTRISILNSNGNVGINNTSPSVRLHVGGNAFFDLPSGGAALENSLTIKKTGQGQINFGSYPGAWTPALQIQNNDNTDYVWISPLQDGNNARIRTGGSGLDIYTGGAVDAGTFAARFENNGSVGLLNLGVSGNVGSTSDPSNNQGNNWITWGYRSDNNPYYCIRTEYKTYGSYTYSRLQLNWHTGVEIGAHSTYGGTRFFNNSPGVGATQIMSIGDGDNHVRVNNYLFAQYLNSTDNAISSGVTGIMAKQGDNYFRTANAAAVLSFLGVTAPTGDNLGNHTATTYLQMGSQWINFNGGGLYSSSYGNHFWPNDQYYWYMRANRGIYITNNSGTARGYVYHNDGGSFGLLSQDGNWKVRVDNSAIENYNTTYAPFIYDRDNTGYYWDGASTSRSAYWNTGPNDSWFPYTNNWNYFRGNTYAWNATWYDENNSGYFIDPASSSRFYNINTLPGFDNYYPSNNAIRMTPNFHFNTPNGYAFIVNWDNGSSGGTQVLRTTGDGFYVYADGQTFTTNWFRPRGGSGLYFQDYCGGWHMSDGTWIRSYCGKSVYLDRGLATAGTVATQYGASARIYSNWDNATGGGIAIADDGGFYDYNDGWVEFRGSTGISVRTDNTAWDMLFRMYRTDGGGPYDKRVATDANAWGLLGASGNAWWQVWSYNFVNASTRESKRNITPVQSNLMAFIRK